MTKLKRIDYLISIIIWLLIFNIFINAKKNFSYDYSAYLFYFGVIGELTFDKFISNIFDQLPFPYIYLPPSGLFEFGFGSLVWLIMKLFNSTSITYALIGSTSIMLRVLILRKIGVQWGWLVLISIYSITLFEANAIRLACAFTIFLLGIMFTLQRRPKVQICLTFILASLFHLQILFQVCFFLIIFFGQRLLFGSQLRLIISLISIIVFVASISGIIKTFGLGKIDDYAGILSISGGFNITTLIGVLIWFSVFWHLIFMSKYIYTKTISSLESSVWIAIVLTGLPALLIYVFVMNIGAIGERIWQVAFMTLASVAFAGSWWQRIRSYQVWFLYILVFITTINVTFRYPLSNFFYPLIPYSSIIPLHNL